MRTLAKQDRSFSGTGPARGHEMPSFQASSRHGQILPCCATRQKPIMFMEFNRKPGACPHSGFQIRGGAFAPIIQTLKLNPKPVTICTTVAIMIFLTPCATIVTPMPLSVTLIRVSIAVPSDAEFTGVPHVGVRTPAVSSSIADHMSRGRLSENRKPTGNNYRGRSCQNCFFYLHLRFHPYQLHTPNAGVKESFHFGQTQLSVQ
jgi:hypothetical protein